MDWSEVVVFVEKPESGIDSNSCPRDVVFSARASPCCGSVLFCSVRLLGPFA